MAATRPTWQRQRRRRGQRGFTLIEILVALALATIGLLGLLAVQVAATRGSATSRAFSEATGLAQDRLEALAHLPYAALGGVAATETGLGPLGVAVAGGQYTRVTTTVQNATAYTLTVRVSWSGADRLAHSVSMATVRSP